jgi:ribosomal-protein-alanine N-acetyltransferase
MDFSVINMEKQHIEQVYEIELHSFSAPWSFEAILGEFVYPGSICLVACGGDSVVGFAFMRHILDEGHISNIAVLPEYRGLGIGDALVKRLVDISREIKISGLTLEVRMGNVPAQRLYGRNGFVFEGIRKGYYTDTKEDAIIMWKYLI